MRYAYVEFKDPASVKIALMLNNIQLIDKPLVIQEATKAVIQSIETPRIINPSMTSFIESTSFITILRYFSFQQQFWLWILILLKQCTKIQIWE
jgi:RNA recognition motif-containing protein